MNDVPWLPYLATQYIGRLKPREVFEWGSGGSTLFFADRVEWLISVEHDPEWYERLRPELPSRVDYRLIPYEPGEIGPDRANPAHYKSGSTLLGPVNFKRYVEAIDACGLFDLVLIDGMARASCLAHAVKHVKPGGCIVLDNTGDRPYYLEQAGALFGNYETGWERIKFMGYGPILAYQWESTIFINRRRSHDGRD